MGKPNIIYIFADQMRASALGCMGAENVRTPNLDKFASESTLFKRAISNHPVCCPARATMLTGLHSINHGLVTNDQQLRTDVKCFADYLNDGGYTCGYVGKWHVDCVDRGVFVPPGKRRRGFDGLWAAYNCNHSYMSAYYYLNDDPEPVWIEGYEPVAQTGAAVGFIRKKSASKSPFCLFVSYGTPHCPYKEMPQEILGAYVADDIELKPNAVSHADKSVLAGYYAHITALDTQFGRIIEAVDECGAKDETIVIFTSDHGDMLWSHDKGWKMKPWLESVNIPFIARWPGRIPAGRVSGAPIGLVDVSPTLLGLAGLDAPENMDGRNLAELFMGDETKAPGSQLICNIVGYTGQSEGFNNWRGIVTKTHTYVGLKDRAWLLFDDERDPCQLNNLVNKPVHENTAQKLKAELYAQLEKIGDPFCGNDEAVAQYVAGKIINSDDCEILRRQLIDEMKKTENNPKFTDGCDVSRYLDYPDENRVVLFFDNEKIRLGKKGEGRKRFHADYYPDGK